MNMILPLIGSSASIEKIREIIEHTVDTGLNVLITGETGVGKEVVALNLYYKSKRKNKLFIRVKYGSNLKSNNFTAIPMLGKLFTIQTLAK